MNMSEIPSAWGFITLCTFQILMNLAAALILLDRPLRSKWYNNALFVIILMVFTIPSLSWAVQHNLTVPRMFVYGLVCILLFRFVFQETWTFSLKAAALFFIWLAFSDLMLVFIGALCGHYYVPYSMFNTVAFFVYAGLAVYTAMPFLAYGLKKSRLFDWLNYEPGLQNSWEVPATTGLIFFQTILLVALLLQVASKMYQIGDFWLLFGVISSYFFFFISTLIIFYFSAHLAEHLAYSSLQNQLSQDISQVLAVMHQQQQDFLFSLGRIHDLLEKQDYGSLDEMMRALNNDVGLVNETLKIGHPFLTAMLNAKLLEAEQRRIHLEAEVNTSVEGPAIERYSMDLVRILGNIISNAMDAVENANEQQRWIRFRIETAGPLWHFAVSNPLLPDAFISDDIFKPGYSTKDGEHSGLGLYIARSLADKMGGMLKFAIKPGPEVVFSLIVPK